MGRWIVLLLGLVALPLRGAAAPPPTCKVGFVLREARSGDYVCVTPASRARVAAENARAPLLWVSGPYGHKTCANGFVWREAFVGDFTCVTAAVRALVQAENATAADRQL
jgi:hypothetical protein